MISHPLKRRLLLGLPLLSLVAGTIGCDRVTKQVAVSTLSGSPGKSFFFDTLRLQYAENPGGFLSFGAAWPPAARLALFTIGTGLATIALVAVILRFRATGRPVAGLALLAAGAASNWIDRAARGHVIDFLNVGIGPVRTGIFNVVDMAILLGIAAVCWTEFARRRVPRLARR